MASEEGPDSGSDNNWWCACKSCSKDDEALWKVLASEAVGTALLVLLSCLPACAPPASPLHRALAAGLVVALLVQSFDHISGAHLNPTVTLAAVLWGRVSVARGVGETAAQLVGGVLGAALLHLVDAGRTPSLCVTLPADHLALYEATLVEAVSGGCLALANCAAWDARTQGRSDSWPLRIGLSVAGLSLAAGEFTGASMNPVRSFGPALWSGDWTGHWVYWAGPLSGSCACTALYCGVWRARARHACAPRPAAAPLPRSAPAPAGCKMHHSV